jgi:hypothetical protein
MKTLILITLPLLLFACRKESNTTDLGSTGNNTTNSKSEPAYLWPLKQGNRWNYKAVIYQTNGEDTANTYDFSMKLQGPETLNDQIYYTYYDSIAHGPAVIRNVDTTAVIMGREIGPYQIFYKKVKNQEVLRSRTELSPADITFTYMTIAYPGTATVDSFENCIRTDEITLDSYNNDTSRHDIYYLKPGIGFVQSTSYVRILGSGEMRRISRVQLMSYKLN